MPIFHKFCGVLVSYTVYVLNNYVHQNLETRKKNYLLFLSCYKSVYYLEYENCENKDDDTNI